MKFRNALIDTIELWNKKPIENEWLFENFRDKYVECLSPEESFLAIDETIKYLLVENDESTSCEILQTTINLARNSKTTEIPHEIMKNKKSLIIKFNNYDSYAKAKLTELFNYYRIK